MKPDGNRGFRATVVALWHKQIKYLYIRRQSLLEMRMNEGTWRRVFDLESCGHYDELYRRIEFQRVVRAYPKNWMQMHDAGFLIAQI